MAAPWKSTASTRCRPAIWRTATTTTRSREFNAVYQRWHEGELGVAMPGGESGRDVLDRYLPVITELRLRYLDDRDWPSDIVVVSHGAAIRLAAATLAGVESSFVLDHHLANTEAVALAPITDGRWSCVQWGSQRPAVLSRTRRASGRRMRCSPPTRWADVGADRHVLGGLLGAVAADGFAVDHQRVQISSGFLQSASVHSGRHPEWRIRVPWQWASPAAHSRQFIPTVCS